MQTVQELVTFHKDVYFPNKLPRQLAFNLSEVRLSWHALERLKEKLGLSRLPCARVNADVIEVTTTKQGEITKLLLRVQFGENDIALVVDKSLQVRTLWLNHAKDSHSTLDESKYVQARG